MRNRPPASTLPHQADRVSSGPPPGEADANPFPSRTIGRVAALHPAISPRELSLYHRHRLIRLSADPSLLAGLSVGDLIAFETDGREQLTEAVKVGGPAPGIWRDSSDGLRWSLPGPGGVNRGELLAFRQRVLHTIREYFNGQGFLEAETPVLVRAPSPEPQFAPLACGGDFLITSPEFQLKRLLTGGFEKIYRIGPAFRGNETGPLHNPEFTLLEWYRVDGTLDSLAADLEALTARLAPLSPAVDDGGFLTLPPYPWRMEETAPPPEALRVDITAPFERSRVADLFAAHLGVRLNNVTTLKGLMAAWGNSPIPLEGPLPDFEQAFFRLWNRMESRLGQAAPLLITHWPAPLASLAALCPQDPTLAQRMEWMIGGIELANGFVELTDPMEQQSRFEADLAARHARGMAPLPLDRAFLDALAQGMPPAAGMALGVDRLVMLLGGAHTLQEVLPFGWNER